MWTGNKALDELRSRAASARTGIITVSIEDLNAILPVRNGEQLAVHGLVSRPDEQEIERRVTAVVREADKGFEQMGGTSRHWVIDWFLPILAKHGLRIEAD